jgi:rod shape-determining protein MreC
MSSSDYLKASSKQLGFATEIFNMSPLIWGGVTLASIGIYLLSSLGTFNPVVAVIKYLTRDSSTSAFQSWQRFSAFTGSLGNVPGVVEENRSLKEKVAELEQRLAHVEVVFDENQQLLKEVGINYSRNYQQLGALVSGYDSNRPEFLFLNKGSADGAHVGDVVVVETILVGKIIEVSSYQSRVRLISSPESTVPVRTAASNLGLLQGGGASIVTVKQILQTFEIKVGAKVFSSGIDGSFPSDLYIGEVSEVRSDSRASTKEAVLRTPLQLQQLNRVKILLLPQ